MGAPFLCQYTNGNFLYNKCMNKLQDRLDKDFLYAGRACHIAHIIGQPNDAEKAKASTLEHLDDLRKAIENSNEVEFSGFIHRDFTDVPLVREMIHAPDPHYEAVFYFKITPKE